MKPLSNNYIEALRQRLAEHDGCSRFGVRDSLLLRAYAEIGTALARGRKAVSESNDSGDEVEDALTNLLSVLGALEEDQDNGLGLYHVFCRGDRSWLIDDIEAHDGKTFTMDRSRAAILTKQEAAELGFPQPPIYLLRAVPKVSETDEDGSTGPLLIG